MEPQLKLEVFLKREKTSERDGKKRDRTQERKQGKYFQINQNTFERLRLKGIV